MFVWQKVQSRLTKKLIARIVRGKKLSGAGRDFKAQQRRAGRAERTGENLTASSEVASDAVTFFQCQSISPQGSGPRSQNSPPSQGGLPMQVIVLPLVLSKSKRTVVSGCTMSKAQLETTESMRNYRVYSQSAQDALT